MKKISSDDTMWWTKTDIYVDVRELSERNQWHLQWAIHIPLIALQVGNHDLPKDKYIGLYCRTGSRSSMAMQILRWQWYNNVYNAGWIIDGIDNIPIVQ